MPKKNFYNDHRGDGFNMPGVQTNFNLASPNTEATNIQHLAHLGNTIHTPKHLGSEKHIDLYPGMRKAKK